MDEAIQPASRLRLLKPLRSIVGLLRVSLSHARKFFSACLRADGEAAGAHLRNLLLSWLEDASQAVIQAQRLLPAKRASRKIDRILVVKLDRIGDMVTTMPAFDALLERYPGATIDVVAHPLPLQLLADDGRVNERIAYRSWLYHPLPIRPPGWGTLRTVARLLARRYPLVVCLRGSFSFLPLALTSRFTASKFVEGEPVIRRYLRAIEAVSGPVSETFPRLAITDERRRIARELLTAVPPAGPRVTVHATASGQAKMWPAERFAALADLLQERLGAAVFFMGAASDEPVLLSIAAFARHKHQYLSTLELPQTAAVIAESDVFIGNDSGLAHVAAAVDTPAVVIWGAPNLNMARPRARSENCTVLYHELACRQACLEFRCSNPNTRECLTRTAVDDVACAVERLLGSAAEKLADRSRIRSMLVPRCGVAEQAENVHRGEAVVDCEVPGHARRATRNDA